MQAELLRLRNTQLYLPGFFGGTLALPSFQREFGLDLMSKTERSNARANMVSLFQAGSFFGAGLQLPLNERVSSSSGPGSYLPC
jgi:hypothetical protein